MSKLNENILRFLTKADGNKSYTVAIIASEINSDAPSVLSALEEMEKLDMVKSVLVFGRVCWALPGQKSEPVPTPAPWPTAPVAACLTTEVEKKSRGRIVLGNEEKNRRIQAVTSVLSTGYAGMNELSKKCSIPLGSMNNFLENNPIFCRVPDSSPPLWRLTAMPILPEETPALPAAFGVEITVNPSSAHPADFEIATAKPRNHLRFGKFDDGALLIQNRDTKIEIQPQDVKRLIDFIGVSQNG